MGNASEVGMKVFGSKTSKVVAAPLFVLAMVLALLGPWTHSVVAQVSGATLSGLVADEQGGPVPDAAVKIKNLGTGVTREIRTNSDGLYSAPNLNPGSYEVSQRLGRRLRQLAGTRRWHWEAESVRQN